MNTVEFKYTIGQTVTIKSLNISAVVTGLMRDNDGLQYRVVYWDNSVRKVEWLFDFELC